MASIILSINAGSSSVKISVYSADDASQLPPKQLVESTIANLTSPPVTFSYQRGSESIKDKKLGEHVKTQDDSFQYFLDHLVDDKGLKEVANVEDISHTCHRIVHGGDYPDAVYITNETYQHLAELTDLAPLHNAPALQIVRTCVKKLPHANNIAFFDSAFHGTMPNYIKAYPIDPKIAKRNMLRKYGFHGISYSFILRSVAEFLKKDINEVNIIALHLGSGASVCAIRNGKSLDTSMGLTPLEGLPGATRSGSVDPSLVFHYATNVGKLSPTSTKDLHITRAEEILNKKSGWKALTGTADFAKISTSQDPALKLAFDILIDRIIGFVGSYYVKLGGNVDALVFAGGIGEKSAELRGRVVEHCGCLGFKIDERKNSDINEGVVVNVGEEGANGKRVLVCRTDEQLEMARECAQSHLSPK